VTNTQGTQTINLRGRRFSIFSTNRLHSIVSGNLDSAQSAGRRIYQLSGVVGSVAGLRNQGTDWIRCGMR